MSKAYDQLMKSANLTAAQNKADKGDYIDSVGELVSICEKEGFIPRYYTDGPQDMVDKVVQDLQYYTRTLVTEEMNLGNMIDSAVKAIESDKKRESMIDTDDEDTVVVDEYQGENEITYDDYEEFAEMQDKNEQANADFFQSIQESD